MSGWDLVIFDCDGVLVDSEPLSLRSLIEALADQGVALTEADAAARFLGRSFKTVLGAIRSEFGVMLNEAAIAALRARQQALFRAHLQPVPHVADLVAATAPRNCVASSSDPQRIALSLGLTGLAPHFGERVFSAVEVAQGKPAPDLFLRAASVMQADPARCVVIEDSPVGVQAARRAGMAALGFTGGGHATGAGYAETLERAGASAIIDDMRRGGEALAALAERRLR